jgi:hypothetical protein
VNAFLNHFAGPSGRNDEETPIATINRICYKVNSGRKNATTGISPQRTQRKKLIYKNSLPSVAKFPAKGFPLKGITERIIPCAFEVP